MHVDRREQQPCAERAGFLFRHACARNAFYHCDACGKAICEEHVEFVDPVELQAMVGSERPLKTGGGNRADSCISCAKKLAKGERSSVRQSRNVDDPYWYSDTHYPGYATYGPGCWGAAYAGAAVGQSLHDPNDFTEADAGAVRAEGDGSFETDASGS